MFKCKPAISFIASFAISALAVASPPSSLAPPESEEPKSVERLVVRKDAQGRLINLVSADRLLQSSRQETRRQRYIVQLRTDIGYDPKEMGKNRGLEAAMRTRSERDMNALTRQLADRGAGLTEVYRLLPLPMLVVEADASGLHALMETDAVQVIYQDVSFKPFLNDTLPIIQAGTLHSAGGTGSGHAVAVLDSGIQRNHPIFSGKLVGEACFASGFSQYPYINDPGCPTGHGFGSTNPGASEACSGTSTCAHGTHVSAIAVGATRTTPQGPTIKGVAPSANLVAVRTGSRTCGNSIGCVEYKLSDTISALSWTYAVRHTHKIAAVNLSYGEYTSFTGHCDSAYADLAQQIDLLTGADIGVVAASGNYALGVDYPGTLPSPACIQNTVSVGAVDKTEAFAPYAQANPTLDLLAPGGIEQPAWPWNCAGAHQCVLSAITSSDYGYMNGTSMAAPHVAGAIAGLRTLWPKYTTSIDDLVRHIKDTGHPITITQAGSTFDVPLVKLGNALAHPTTPSSVNVSLGYCYDLNMVSWPASSGTISHYQVQGASSPAFANPTALFQGSGTVIPLHVGPGTWIRVRACDGPACSPWKNGTTTTGHYAGCL